MADSAASSEAGVAAEGGDVGSTWKRVAVDEGRGVHPTWKRVAAEEGGVAAEEDGIDPTWKRVATSSPKPEDVVKLLMLGGIPGICGPGRTSEERETIMNHNRHRVEVVNSLWLDTTAKASCCGGRSLGQSLLTNVASSGEELLFLFGRAFVPSCAISAFVFLMYLFTYLVHFGWMYFALPSTVLPTTWLVSARDSIDAPDWVRWMVICGSGLRVLSLTSYLLEHKNARANTRDAWRLSKMSWFGLGWDVLMFCYLKRTDTSVNNWDSDAVGHRVGTFFLVVVGVILMLVWLYAVSTLLYFSDDEEETKSRSKITIGDWKLIRESAASVLRVNDAAFKLEDRANLVQMLECLFKLVDGRKSKNAVEHRTHVQDKYSAMVWLCIDALAHLPANQRDPEFALSTICSFGVTAYDCFSSTCEWYVSEPALAPIAASTTHQARAGSSILPVREGSPDRPGRAYVETSSGTGDTGPSFDTRGETSAGRPYPSSSGGVRVTIPMKPQTFVSNPEHTGLLGLVNTAAAIWFLVHWELDVYHAFLAAAVLGELWAQLWIGIWWSAGEAPLSAFVDPVHWLIGQREHVPDKAVRLLAGEASAAVLGIVAALTVIDYYVAGGVVGIVALGVGGVLKMLLKGEDIAVVCFLAYLSELVLEVVIVVTSGNFTLVSILLGVTAALESMVLTIRLLQVLVGRSLIGRPLRVGAMLTEKRENWFARAVACGYWGAVFTRHSPTYIMESVCSGRFNLSEPVVALAKRVGYTEAFHTESLRAKEEPGWGYVVSTTGSRTCTAWNLPDDKGFTVFEVGAWYGKRYPCL